MQTSKQIRQAFMDFFVSKGHTIVKSAPVIPINDPTLLFTNAGMNQFKDVFLGNGTRSYSRAVDTQKCIRVSGKHNDLEEVGKDHYHHTFFEMLGNWSFGDYYKAEAIQWAWELFTEIWDFPKEKLYATVHTSDDDAEQLWEKVTDIAKERILRFDKENFWEMADTGPCGPCSEIHIDLGEGTCHKDHECGVNVPHCDRYIELWNLVFIQFERDAQGRLHNLPEKHVDTGAGFERIVAYLQNKKSNYHTDLFMPIIRKIEEISGKTYDETDGMPFRVIADHIRALTFAITDGAIPSNEGQGYVLRRILRRGARFGRKLEIHEPFIYKLITPLVEIMGETFPEIKEKANHTALVIKSEEESFNITIDRGIELFDNLVETLKAEGSTTIPGEEAFKLYDTYGFPLDLTQLMAEEIGMTVDVETFSEEMEKQRERSREASKWDSGDTEKGKWQQLTDGESSIFLGYETTTAETKIHKWRKTDEDKVEIVLTQTPFYGESGGQIGDSGNIYNDDMELRVLDTQKSGDDTIHICRVVSGEISDKKAIAEVTSGRRQDIARNHTATHLLHKALKTVLGEHAHQAGSLVAPDRLRFDFTHFAAIEPNQLEEIERMVNQKILENLPLETFVTSFDEAKEQGATALFGEKYGDEVRVVKIEDYSMELCGGTHCEATGDIGMFKILSESSVASGVRRIEAITGRYVYEMVRNQEEILSEISHIFRCKPEEITSRIDKLMIENKNLMKEIETLRQKSAGSMIDDMISNARTLDGVKIVSAKLENADMDTMKKTADQFREKVASGVAIFGTENDGKVNLVVAVTDELVKKGVKAGDIVKPIANIVNGGGGGRPHLAQAGGKSPEKLDEAIEKSYDIVKGFLS